MTGCLLFLFLFTVLWIGLALAMIHAIITAPGAIVAVCILFALMYLRAMRTRFK